MNGERTYPTIKDLIRDDAVTEPTNGVEYGETESVNGEEADGAYGAEPHKKGLVWDRKFGTGNPYDEIEWETRTAKIAKGSGEVVFEQHDIEVPNFWSQTATDIVASKYFRGQLDTPERETSVRQMIDRVVETISEWGLKDGYFATRADNENFKNDLRYLLVHQYASFNSPVWFNVGVYDTPQCSACFILAVEDNMKSILEWYQNEGWIFKGGSGAGLDVSNLRSSREALSKGGFSSGPVSFMKGADGVASSIRSGGTTRRAAKMVVLNVGHPDIKDFIYSKKVIEDMTKVLQSSGVQNSIEGNMFDPYTLLPYQNANNSIRVTDEFMQRVLDDEDWELKAVTTGETIETLKARDILKWAADAAWASADPGIQFDTTINNWHTCSNTGRITASNPCSEYMHLDNSACNLASINTLKFVREDGTYNVDGFKNAVDTFILAQDIIVDNSSYPTEKITNNAKAFRELGLGYSNLGATLMSLGFAYDSDEGRAMGGALTSLLCGEAYAMSARIAKHIGSFSGYEENKEPMIDVMKMHRAESDALYRSIAERDLLADGNLRDEARNVWYDAVEAGGQYGFRNSQATVIAPAGTISFMMDCATTGIEPELALVKYKKLVGGGTLKLVNNQVSSALRHLGYTESQINEISDHILEHETIEGAPHISEEHLPVFDCSFKPQNGQRSIHYMGHLRMMAAAQPFVSGAISKTVNMPHEATVDDMYNAFIHAWKLGLKAVAFYRDGSKSVQPLQTTKDEKLVERSNGYTRIKLPEERPAVTHKFSIAGHEGYLTVGLYPDTNKPGETFITIAKEGTTLAGLFDVIATLISMCLQSGMPLKTLVKKFKDMRFEPAGVTTNADIPMAKSFLDYIFRYLGMKYLSPEDQEEIFGEVHNGNGSLFSVVTETNGEEKNERQTEEADAKLASSGFVEAQMHVVTDAPMCECGSLMNKAGSCYTCPNCFAVTGVCN